MRLRLLERVGSALGFSPEGRSVRVWVRGMPGGDETEVVPGTIRVTRIPVPAKSALNDSVKPRTAQQAALYAVAPGTARNAAAEVMLRMCPLRRAIISGRKERVR